MDVKTQFMDMLGTLAGDVEEFRKRLRKLEEEESESQNYYGTCCLDQVRIVVDQLCIRFAVLPGKNNKHNDR